MGQAEYWSTQDASQCSEQDEPVPKSIQVRTLFVMADHKARSKREAKEVTQQPNADMQTHMSYVLTLPIGQLQLTVVSWPVCEEHRKGKGAWQTTAEFREHQRRSIPPRGKQLLLQLHHLDGNTVLQRHSVHFLQAQEKLLPNMKTRSPDPCTRHYPIPTKQTTRTQP